MVYKGETQIHALPNRQLVGAKEFSTVSINALAINFVSAAVGTVPAYIAAPPVLVQISCRNAEKSVFRTPEIPFLKYRYPILKRNIGKLIFVVISGLIKTVIIDRSEEHTSELQSRENLVCRLLREKKNTPSTNEIRRVNR